MASTITPLAAPHAPGIRARRFTLDTQRLRYWFRDNAAMSHRANSVHLLFPAGEKFFIRSVLHYADRITDPVLQQRIKAFAAQEAQHGRAHEQEFDHLEAEGLPVRDWIRWYESVAYGRLEPKAPPKLRLAITAALEHLTATMATQALENEFFEGVDPEMRELLQWHACEEIEHKDVAFDVLTAVGGGYPIRAVGMVAALTLLFGFWEAGYRHLVNHDTELSPERLRRDASVPVVGEFRRRIVRDVVRTWFRPGFHPNHVDNRGVAEAWLAARGVA
jgi:predicted metal-dependent hydrolase